MSVLAMVSEASSMTSGYNNTLKASLFGYLDLNIVFVFQNALSYFKPFAHWCIVTHVVTMKYERWNAAAKNISSFFTLNVFHVKATVHQACVSRTHVISCLSS